MMAHWTDEEIEVWQRTADAASKAEMNAKCQELQTASGMRGNPDKQALIIRNVFLKVKTQLLKHAESADEPDRDGHADNADTGVDALMRFQPKLQGVHEWRLKSGKAE